MTDLLQNRTWRELRATARAHHWPFDNDFRKEEARAALSQVLVDGLLKRALHRLTPAETEALMALKAAGGRMIRWQFCRAYGQIRPFRPWRCDAPINPWRHPISLAEKLWFLGLIEVDTHQAVLLPVAVSDRLPTVPHPQTVIWEADAAQPSPAAVVRDVAALLGTLLHTPVRLLHGRWLPPYSLKALNQRLAQPENLAGIRSTFQCDRLRFLHYLAQVAGLVSVQGGVLLPTAEAWVWLDRPYKEAFAHLLAAIQADLHQRHPLWQRFRLASVRAEVWDYLLSLPAEAYSLDSLDRVLRLRTLDWQVRQDIEAAFTGPLAWLGLGQAATDRVRLLAVTPVLSQPATLQTHAASLSLTLPAAPFLRPLVELWAIATLDAHGLRLDADSLGRAQQAGHDTTQVARMLVELTNTPLPQSTLAQLDGWSRSASRVRLRQTTILEAASPADMARIRADWRLKPLLGAQLSPRHCEVRDEKRLRQRLARRGYPVPALTDRHADPIPRQNDTDPAYLWLAVRLCQALGQAIPLPVTFPGAAARQFEAELGPRRDVLHGLVEQCREVITHKLKGQLQGMPLVEQVDPARIRARVQQSLTHGGSLRIRYFSPAAGQETERTIEPHTIYERHHANYIEAWCYHDDAQRTFRMDRILAVL